MLKFLLVAMKVKIIKKYQNLLRTKIDNQRKKNWVILKGQSIISSKISLWRENQRKILKICKSCCKNPISRKTKMSTHTQSFRFRYYLLQAI